MHPLFESDERSVLGPGVARVLSRDQVEQVLALRLGHALHLGGHGGVTAARRAALARSLAEGGGLRHGELVGVQQRSELHHGRGRRHAARPARAAQTSEQLVLESLHGGGALLLEGHLRGGRGCQLLMLFAGAALCGATRRRTFTLFRSHLTRVAAPAF